MVDMTVGQLVEVLGNLEDELVLVEEVARLQSKVRHLESSLQRQEFMLQTIKSERDDIMKRYQELRREVIDKGKA